jgi:phospholipase/carboxylesterase
MTRRAADRPPLPSLIPPPPGADAPAGLSRRAFIASAVAATAGLMGCERVSGPGDVEGDDRIVAPLVSPTASITPGLHELGVGVGRDGLLFVPSTYKPTEPLPLVVLLHGAGGDASAWFGSYDDRGEAGKIIMLAIDSRGPTWDAIFENAFGPDVRFIEQALKTTFAHCAIARNRITLAGFSDGASYALSLGTANGDLFDHVIAYSPGYMPSSNARGKPRIFVSHGTLDGILPIAGASRVIVPKLRSRGYQVEYVEFEGVHEVPQQISDRALGWLAADYARG